METHSFIARAEIVQDLLREYELKTSIKEKELYGPYSSDN